MDSFICSYNSHQRTTSSYSCTIQACSYNFEIGAKQRGQATVETALLAAVLLLILTIPVHANGDTLVTFVSELLKAWTQFQDHVWDALLLLPMVLK